MKKLNVIITWTFMGYFLILFGERLQSLIRGFMETDNMMFKGAFGCYTTLATIAAMVITVILLVAFNPSFWKGLFSSKVDVNFPRLCIPAGVLLVSGMLYTPCSIQPLQFGAYGVLILGMVLETVKHHRSSYSRFLLWFSLGYLVALSMAIPVVYRTFLPIYPIFHAAEAAISFVLVVLFTAMLRLIFQGRGENLYNVVPILLVVFGNGFLIIARWSEEPNWFLLFASGAAVIMFIIGRIVSLLPAFRRQSEVEAVEDLSDE